MSLKKFKFWKQIKYSLSSFVSSMVEFVIFFLITTFYKNTPNIILYATLIGRTVGTIINFIINKFWCFQVFDKTIFQIFLFSILFVVKLYLSYFFVNYLVDKYNINPTLIKVPIDLTLFVVGYVVQNFIIFRKKGKKEEESIE